MMENGCSGGATAFAHMLADARHDLSPSPPNGCGEVVADHTVIRVCQASVDVMKPYLLMSGETRLALCFSSLT